jgi:SAM-dependent methyltransferase
VSPDWFEEYFGEEYLLLYPHRDEEDAGRIVALLSDTVALVPGWRVLDVACGTGRHAAAFRARGAQVTGLDLSRHLLLRAQTDARIPVIRSDVRRIPVRPRAMDFTVNLFTSFGYFDSEAEHTRALCEMVATVRHGGWFALDFLNADRLPRDLVRHEEAELAGQPVQIDRWLDGTGEHVFKSITTADGRRFVERVRLFDAEHLGRLFADADCVVRHRFGDYDGGPLAAHAPRVILVGTVA